MVPHHMKATESLTVKASLTSVTTFLSLIISLLIPKQYGYFHLEMEIKCSICHKRRKTLKQKYHRWKR